MNPLSRLQMEFQNHLLTGECCIESAIVETKAVSIQTRLDIYRNAYQSRLVEALASNFPCLYIHLGTDEFERIAMDYIDANPSTWRSIRWFGDTFSYFLSQYCDAAYDYLAELAEFEWNMALAFDASDVNVFQLEDMMHIPPDAWGDVTFVMQPSVSRVNFLWNVVPIWEAIMNDEPSVVPTKNAEDESWILWRHDYMNRFYRLSQDEAWALDAISTGASFGDVCEGLCQWHDEDAVGMNAASLMKGWIQAGLIANALL